MLISEEIKTKCSNFADLRLNSSKLYKQRGESNKDKIWQDIYNGALGEWCAYKYLIDLGFECSEPDMTILPKSKKSHSADLVAKRNGIEYAFHIKTQNETSIKRYGVSWLVQRNNKELVNPSATDFILGIGINPNEAYVTAVVPLAEIVNQNLLQECKVPAYRTTKYAIYLNDIIKANIPTNL